MATVSEDPYVNQPRHRPTLRVVGGGMAAYALLKRLVENGASDSYQISLVAEEPILPYDRVNLTEGFTGKEVDDLLLADQDWYDKNQIELLLGNRVQAINRSESLLEFSNDTQINYDLLVLATGSYPFVPPIEGTDLPGVFVYRTIEDIEKIKAYAKRSQRAAVLGGGLLGIEAAKALYDLGQETHILEVAPSLMPRQLNSESGTLLRKLIEKLGVSVHLLRRAEKILGVDNQLNIDFGRDESFCVDMVVISAGIRPRDELAKQANLKVDPRCGIVVDEHLSTEDPRIFAIGECISWNEQRFGLVGPCYNMAHILADNLKQVAKGEATTSSFKGAAPASRLKLMGVDVNAIGLAIGEADAAEVLIHQSEDDEEAYCRTLLVQSKRLVGAISVGPWPELERISGAIAKRQRLSGRQIRRFRNSGEIWGDSDGDSVLDWPANATVCSCLNVTRGELTDALHAGASDPEALAKVTGASTVCGSCKNLLCELAGKPKIAVSPKGSKGLLVASIIAAIVIPIFLLVGPLPFADSVQSSWRQVDQLWQESFLKQVTGYTLLGISTLGLLFSLRKRISWIRIGDFGLWRSLHGIFGVGTLVGFFLHTGLRLGDNFNFALALLFLLLNFVGAFTGFVAALESRLEGEWGKKLRAWRPQLTNLHIWLFWPIPALVLFHVISVYYY